MVMVLGATVDDAFPWLSVKEPVMVPAVVELPVCATVSCPIAALDIFPLPGAPGPSRRKTSGPFTPPEPSTKLDELAPLKDPKAVEPSGGSRDRKSTRLNSSHLGIS